SLFGSYLPLNKTVHVDLIAHAGQNDYDTRRNAAAGSFGASTSGNQYAASANVGMDLAHGPTSFLPFLRMQQIEAKINGFGENGAGDALGLSSFTVKSTLYTFGGKLDYSFGTEWAEVTPHIKAEIHHETQDSGTVNAQLLSANLSTDVSALPTD